MTYPFSKPAEPADPPSLEIEVGGQQLRCEYDYSPGTPDVHYLPNGDPGYPGDPEEFTVNKVFIFVGPTPVNPEAWLDITDLVIEATASETLGVVGERAYEALQDALAEAREADAEDRAAEARDDYDERGDIP